MLTLHKGKFSSHENRCLASGGPDTKPGLTPNSIFHIYKKICWSFKLALFSKKESELTNLPTQNL